MRACVIFTSNYLVRTSDFCGHCQSKEEECLVSFPSFFLPASLVVVALDDFDEVFGLDGRERLVRLAFVIAELLLQACAHR